MYYYYEPDTGEIQIRSNKPYSFTDLPFVQGDLGTKYSEYRVNTQTQELEPKT